MNVYRPLRAVLFFYECVRLLLLVVFLFLTPPESSGNGFFFPYVVYLSSNALFPLMALFVWLRPEEYRNYLTLYIAGKIIGVALFYVWEILTIRQVTGIGNNVIMSMFLLGGSALVSLADILSVWGAWTLKNKFRQAFVQPLESSGQSEYGGV